MKFSDFEYERPDVNQVEQQLDALDEQLKNAADYPAFNDAFHRLDALMAHLDTLENIASVHHTMDTTDPHWEAESDFFDTVSPVLASRFNKVIGTVLDSPWRSQLEKDVPVTWFQIQENARAVVSDAIIEELQEENRLASRYQKLIGSAKVDFEGKEWTLSALSAPMNDADRDRREKAHKAYWGWFEQNEEQIGGIYDQMVAVRDRMARKMGYDSYILFGYRRMNRLDYGYDDVALWRKQILGQAVPLASSLYEKQRERLGVDRLQPWDEKVEFPDGMPTPLGTREELVDKAAAMYRELSEETGSFFAMMKEEELMDLAGRFGKAAGGYCTSLADYQRPFIFANFNGTRDDVEVLTHEAGHAFQCWQSRNAFPYAMMWPTMESCEIHSMSMEFLTWPWMERFFGADANKFWHSHLADAIEFLPYGALVDHFQHEVYAHPQWNHAQRMSAWRSLEKQYLPHKNYEEIDALERGGWWMRQMHIFLDPFYYIDYTLAQMAALQMWKRMIEQDPTLFEDYLAICKVGGSLPFSGILKTAHLRSPFEPGALDASMQAAADWFKNPKAPQ